jgi:hypothetical protein
LATRLRVCTPTDRGGSWMPEAAPQSPPELLPTITQGGRYDTHTPELTSMLAHGRLRWTSPMKPRYTCVGLRGMCVCVCACVCVCVCVCASARAQFVCARVSQLHVEKKVRCVKSSCHKFTLLGKAMSRDCVQRSVRHLHVQNVNMPRLTFLKNRICSQTQHHPRIPLW